MLDTDYATYSLVYDCDIVDGQLEESFWVLSRTPSVDSDTHSKIKAAVSANLPGYNQDNIVMTSQQGCEYVWGESTNEAFLSS